MPLKPQDLLVCLELATRDRKPWTYAQLAEAVGISASEANKAVERSIEAGLVAPGANGAKPAPLGQPLLDFLAHGVRHAFFARPGRLVRGMPTAHSAPPLDERVGAGGDAPLVWPDPEGSARGQAVEPLYPSVPRAARRNPRLYELLALVDAVRCGRARERSLAIEELRSRLIR